jgi:5-methylcytosine-specific restriction endonuclease McrA
MTEYKTCTKCGQNKPITSYYPDPNTGRYRAACKLCCNSAVNAKRAKNRDAYRQTNLDYYYANKEQLNDYRRSKWPELYQSKIEYHKQKGKKYRTENPDKIAGIARRRRAKKRANGWEKYTEAEVLKLWGSVCHICGSQIDLTLPRRIGIQGWEMGLHIDHVIPISKGGPDKLSNVKPSHGICNAKKRATLLSD